MNDSPKVAKVEVFCTCIITREEKKTNLKPAIAVHTDDDDDDDDDGVVISSPLHLVHRSPVVGGERGPWCPGPVAFRGVRRTIIHFTH